ncbi:hypothetical protein ABT095_34550 [Kitasatospora sp. NPDC002227]|uniref:hypothetical protein n=1 Tax=Kitasatospora sp. NPDC002227 TaxID=3154773 RepID=UPI003328C98F
MTLIQPPMMVHGGTHPARAFRMMVRDLARGSQGVTEGNDLKVRPTATPGAAVRVGDGSAIVRGATFGQGCYTQYNIGDAAVQVAPTAGTGRTDLLVLRVEDPEYEGSRNPAVDQIGYFQVIPNVSATATTPPQGMTAIPLARITLPPNCQTVTDAMITDLRSIANPRRSRRIFTGFPKSDDNYTAGQNTPWPLASQWRIWIPDWATQTRIILQLNAVQVIGNGVWALQGFQFGALTGETVVIDSAMDYSQRINVVSADTLNIPADHRDTVQTLRSLITRSPGDGGQGLLQADVATTIVADVEFEEGVY